MSPTDLRNPATPDLSRTRRSRIAFVTLRVLATVSGLVGLVGASYFTFVAAPADGGVDTPFEWFVGLWKIVIACTLLAAAAGPRLRPSARIAVLTWAVVADLAFCAVKLVHYHESAAVPFVVIDLAMLALVRTSSTSNKE